MGAQGQAVALALLRAPHLAWLVSADASRRRLRLEVASHLRERTAGLVEPGSEQELRQPALPALLRVQLALAEVSALKRACPAPQGRTTSRQIDATPPQPPESHDSSRLGAMIGADQGRSLSPSHFIVLADMMMSTNHHTPEA
jgi:hypothetical protein